MAALWRWIRLLAVGGVLLLAVWLGIKGGADAYPNAASTPQRLTAVLQIAYGLLALASLGALVTDRPWLRVALALWGVTVTMTGLWAPVVWGDQGWGSAALGGGATAVVASVVVWGGLAHAQAVAARPI